MGAPMRACIRPAPPSTLEKARVKGADIRHLSVDFADVADSDTVELHRFADGEYTYAFATNADGRVRNMRGLHTVEWNILKKRGVI